MNPLGWWTASVIFGLLALVAATGWALAHAFLPPIAGCHEWEARKQLAARIALPVIAVVWFLAIAYGASHMFDQMPRPARTTTVTVEVPR